MKRKVMAIAVILILALTVTACGENPAGGEESASETFKGVASEQIYASEEAAMKAFLENEFQVTYDETNYDPFDGSVTTQKKILFSAEYVEHSIIDDLKENEIADLNLKSDERTDLIKAEKVSVVFTMYTESERGYLAELSGDKNTQKMILLAYRDGSYRYYTPLPEVGELLTRSYFESVLDETKYANCTIDYFNEGNRKEDGKTYITEQWKYIYKFTAAAYYEHHDRKQMYHDGISKEMWEYFFGTYLMQGAVTLEQIDDLYKQYSDSEKPWEYKTMSIYYDKYMLPCGEKFGAVIGGYNDDGELEFEPDRYSGDEGIVDEPGRVTPYLLTWLCTAGSSPEVHPFYFKKTQTGFEKGKYFFTYKSIDVTVVNGRLGKILSDITEYSFDYVVITFSDFGTTVINPPKPAVNALTQLN